MDHFQHPPDHRADLLPVAQRVVLFILPILCIHVSFFFVRMTENKSQIKSLKGITAQLMKHMGF
jgi:hypothetical protein